MQALTLTRPGRVSDIFLLCNEICMTYLVHVWFDAAYKKGVGGTECGHQGMERVLKHISNKRIKIKQQRNWLLSPNIFLCVY